MVKLIGIDPGHGGWDNGANGFGMLEKDLNLDISLRVNDLFEQDDRFNTVMTRTTDEYISLDYRSNLFNNHNVDIGLSVHHNAGGGQGSEVLCTVGDYPDSVAFANMLLDEFLDNCGLGASGDGIVRREYPGEPGLDYYHMIRETAMTTVIGENGFVDNEYDNNQMQTEAFRDGEAKAYYEAVCEFYGYQPRKIDDGILERGDEGPSVKQLQRKLNRLDYGLVVDGDFGPATEDAVKDFQSKNGLVVDGKYGPATQQKLSEVLEVLEELKKRVTELEETAERKPESPDKLHTWAEEAWQWAIDNNITGGNNPQIDPAREEVATMLYRYHKNL